MKCLCLQLLEPNIEFNLESMKWVLICWSITDGTSILPVKNDGGAGRARAQGLALCPHSSHPCRALPPRFGPNTIPPGSSGPGPGLLPTRHHLLLLRLQPRSPHHCCGPYPVPSPLLWWLTVPLPPPHSRPDPIPPPGHSPLQRVKT